MWSRLPDELWLDVADWAAHPPLARLGQRWWRLLAHRHLAGPVCVHGPDGHAVLAFRVTVVHRKKNSHVTRKQLGLGCAAAAGGIRTLDVAVGVHADAFGDPSMLKGTLRALAFRVTSDSGFFAGHTETDGSVRCVPRARRPPATRRLPFARVSPWDGSPAGVRPTGGGTRTPSVHWIPCCEPTSGRGRGWARCSLTLGKTPSATGAPRRSGRCSAGTVAHICAPCV